VPALGATNRSPGSSGYAGVNLERDLAHVQEPVGPAVRNDQLERHVRIEGIGRLQVKGAPGGAVFPG